MNEVSHKKRDLAVGGQWLLPAFALLVWFEPSHVGVRLLHIDSLGFRAEMVIFGLVFIATPLLPALVFRLWFPSYRSNLALAFSVLVSAVFSFILCVSIEGWLWFRGGLVD